MLDVNSGILPVVVDVQWPIICLSVDCATVVVLQAAVQRAVLILQRDINVITMKCCCLARTNPIAVIETVLCVLLSRRCFAKWTSNHCKVKLGKLTSCVSTQKPRPGYTQTLFRAFYCSDFFPIYIRKHVCATR